MDAAKPNTTSNWLGNESAKRKRLENSGEEKLLQKLKPLGDVIDLKNPAEVKKLAALVPHMKSDDGGKLLQFLAVNCLRYMPALYACATCLRYMLALYACAICLLYNYACAIMPALLFLRYMLVPYACAICLCYMLALYACAICLVYMPALCACAIMPALYAYMPALCS